MDGRGQHDGQDGYEQPRSIHDQFLFPEQRSGFLSTAAPSSLLPAVPLFSVTPRRAGPAILVSGEVHGHLPAAEVDVLQHMLLLTAVGVDLMARPAGPPLVDLVYMDDMEVPVPVAKTRCRFREPVRKSGLVVAGEAQCVPALGKSGIKIRRIVLHQQPPEVRSMRVMT